jgi:hypothetical protein
MKGSKDMSQSRAFNLRQAEHRPKHYTDALPEIDKTRATAVLVRQSKTGADTAQAESRETQLGLQEYAKLLYGNEEPNVRLYDEGAGVSGQKRIDEREHLDRLYQDMHKGIIGTLVLAREDRLFRNKHMDQVGTFTKLAEEKRIKAIVPPISTASTEEKTRVYDFTSYRDLTAFQDKMREAYGYLLHVKYMHLCKQNKADKGGYDGRALPPGLAVRGKKQDQEVVIYEPWAEEMRKLALRARALSWDMGKLTREVAQKAFLFREIPEEDKERYLFKTNVHHIKGVGYKPHDPATLKSWLTNVMYIGWWQPRMNGLDIITDHHDAILDYTLFAEGYAALTGYTLEGEPVKKNRSITRLKKTRETPPEWLFHGKLLVKSLKPGLKAFIRIDTAYGKKYYVGTYSRDADMKKERFLHLPAESFDNIVINRLKALEAADKNIQKKVKTTLEEVYNQQGEDFVSIHDQIRGIDIQLAENTEKRLDTSKKDPLYAKLQEQADDLLRIKEELEAKKGKLGIVDSQEEIELLHSLLGNFDDVWPKFSFEKKQRAFNILINRIEVEVVSTHWIRLTIDWLDAICPRLDVAYVWKAGATHAGAFSEEEDNIIRKYYYDAPKLEIMRFMPKRSWSTIQGEAEKLEARRKPFRWPREYICQAASYCDFMPNLDGNYLFGNYETTLRYINTADKNTSRSKDPLYPIWLLPTEVEALANFLQRDLEGIERAMPRPIEDANPIACSR